MQLHKKWGSFDGLGRLCVIDAQCGIHSSIILSKKILAEALETHLLFVSIYKFYWIVKKFNVFITSMWPSNQISVSSTSSIIHLVLLFLPLIYRSCPRPNHKIHPLFITRIILRIIQNRPTNHSFSTTKLHLPLSVNIVIQTTYFVILWHILFCFLSHKYLLNLER